MIELEGANIHYETIGQGPILIFIPGANGTGDIFIPLAKQLQDQFTVIAVDRRGYGQSKLTKPLPKYAEDPHNQYRVKCDAEDIAALAKHLSNEPVYILGSSSGSIVAMHVLKEHPDIVKKIAFHEPPINSFLPDRKKWQEENEDIVQTAFHQNMNVAMKKFATALNVAPIDAKSMSKPADTDGDSKRVQEMLNWFRYEIRQYTSSDITLDDFQPYIDRIVLLNGLDSKGSFPQDVNQYISEQLGLEIINIPGGHLGYIQKSEEFAKALITMF